MHRHFLAPAVFLSGLLAVAWIATGYLGSNLPALLFTLLVGACYLAGALELLRYRGATATLVQALDDLAGAPPANLDDWLQRLHPGLRTAVRQRVEGERAPLPGPALTPYLVGLLVLLGMLGTLLGMMATLRGTGLALESASDLHAIRASLAAPVKGLGFAFGTSIAGVATSAMLGLLSALARRERAHAVQALDARAATTLRVHSRSYRDAQGLELMRRQVELMPALLERLQAMMDAVERRAAEAQAHQSAQQQAMLDHAGAAWTRLAESVAQSLRAAAADSALAASSALQPAVDATLAGVGAAVDRQLRALADGVGATTSQVSDGWRQLLAGQRDANAALALDLRATLDGFGEAFELRSRALVEGVSIRLDASTAGLADAWRQGLSQQQAAAEALASRNAQALAAAAEAIAREAGALAGDVAQSHATLQSSLAAQDAQRLAAWRDALASTGAALRADWEQAGERAARQQQAVCEALSRTAREIGEQSKAHAGETIAEVSRLMQTAADAPRAAAAVVTELREQLSASMVRDAATLDERNRLLATLDTLLEGVTGAATAQREAIDALVSTSAELMQRVARQLDERIASEAGKLDAAAAQVTAGAFDVASLGDAFGAAVERFGASNDALAARLQQVEDALGRSLARSDEQLAYYVAQAREVIDLSLLTQKQVIEDLQRLAANGNGEAEAA